MLIKIFVNFLKVSLLIFCLSLNLQAKSIEIGTGSQKAVFYPTANAICEILSRKTPKIKCQALISKGAEYNLQKLGEKFNFSISQLPLQYSFYKNNSEIRSIASMHIEHLSILVSKNSNIHSLKDLVGKRVNIGNQGSGSRIYVEQILNDLEIDLNSFKTINEDDSSKIADLICSDKIDAVLYFVGHPNQIYRKALNCGAHLLALTRAQQDIINTAENDFINSVITKNTYKKQRKVNTIGIHTVLNGLADTPDELVTEIIKTLVQNRRDLIRLNSVYKEVNPLNIITLQDKAPLHPAVVKFLKRE